MKDSGGGGVLPAPILSALVLLALVGGGLSGWLEFRSLEEPEGGGEGEGLTALDPLRNGVPPVVEEPSAPEDPTRGWQSPGAALLGADLSGRTFLECDLSEANLTGAKLDGARFHDCALAGADFRGASLGGRFYLRRCALDGARFDPGQLALLTRESFRLGGSTVLDKSGAQVELNKLLRPMRRDASLRETALRVALDQGPEAARALDQDEGSGLPPEPSTLLRGEGR